MEKARQYSALTIAAALALGGIGAAGAAAAPSAYYPSGECSNINPQTQRACVWKRMERKQREMEALLVRARTQVARRHEQHRNWDDRGDPAYLDRSQAAWNAYVESHCTVMAAFPGGSNSAISERVAGCSEYELDDRIAYLRHLLEETGPFGP